MRFQLNHYIFQKLYYNFFILSTSFVNFKKIFIAITLFNTFCDTFITIQIHFSVDFYFEIWYNTYDCDENYT